MQVYSDPRRESDPFALPDVEVFKLLNWYWWTCSPGCLPDSEPIGPFDTKQDAIDNAQADNVYEFCGNDDPSVDVDTVEDFK